jgi:class 3 adenylate cyclase
MPAQTPFLFLASCWRRKLAFRVLTGLGLVLLWVLAGIWLIMETKGRALVREESHKLIEETGRNAVSRLEIRLREIAALTVSAGHASLSLPRDAGAVEAFLPGLVDYGGDAGVAGGGYWPEPGAFAPGVACRAFFWARDPGGDLRYIDDYNTDEAPYHGEEWYVPAEMIEPDAVYWSRSYIDPHSLQPMVTCSAPLRSEGRFEGVFTIDLKLEGLEQFIESIRQRTGGWVVLLDRNNRFITFPTGSQEMRDKALSRHDTSEAVSVAFKTVAEFAAEVPEFKAVATAAEQMNSVILGLARKVGGGSADREPLLASRISSATAEEAALIAAAVANPPALRPGVDDGLFGDPILLPKDIFNAESSLLYRFHVPDAYWKLFIVKPVREATLVADHIVNLLLFYVTATVLVVIGFFSWWLNRGVLQRIASTTGKVKETRRMVAEKRFSELAAVLPAPEGEDEIAELVGVMRSLTLELKTTYEALQAQSRAFERFVPKQFLQFLGRNSIEEIRLGDQVLSEMAVLFADVRGFTSLSEKMSPKENFDFINLLLQCLGPAVRGAGGFIDKYIGDAIMALFPGGADDAIRAGVIIQDLLRDFNKTRALTGLPPVSLGVGIHSGLLMLGTIGEEERMEGTVISDAVNLASRIEGLTSTYGCPLLVSEAALATCESARFSRRPIARVKVKGKSQDVRIYEILDAETPGQRLLKEQTLSDFSQGAESLDLGAAADALVFFERVLAVNPDDRAAITLRDLALGQVRESPITSG